MKSSREVQEHEGGHLVGGRERKSQLIIVEIKLVETRIVSLVPVKGRDGQPVVGIPGEAGRSIKVIVLACGPGQRLSRRLILVILKSERQTERELFQEPL